MQIADGKPGHYYVTARSSTGRVAFLLGPFTQQRPGTLAHRQALTAVSHAWNVAMDRYSARSTFGAEFGTGRLPLTCEPPRGKLGRYYVEA